VSEYPTFPATVCGAQRHHRSVGGAAGEERREANAGVNRA
jgi:hypothetical protein